LPVLIILKSIGIMTTNQGAVELKLKRVENEDGLCIKKFSRLHSKIQAAEEKNY
jgi:hypothetical protein